MRAPTKRQVEGKIAFSEVVETGRVDPWGTSSLLLSYCQERERKLSISECLCILVRNGARGSSLLRRSIRHGVLPRKWVLESATAGCDLLDMLLHQSTVSGAACSRFTNMVHFDSQSRDAAFTVVSTMLHSETEYVKNTGCALLSLLFGLFRNTSPKLLSENDDVFRSQVNTLWSLWRDLYSSGGQGMVVAAQLFISLDLAKAFHMWTCANVCALFICLAPHSTKPSMPTQSQAVTSICEELVSKLPSHMLARTLVEYPSILRSLETHFPTESKLLKKRWESHTS